MIREFVASIMLLISSASFIHAGNAETFDPVELVKAKISEKSSASPEKTILLWTVDLRNKTAELRRPFIIVSFRDETGLEIYVDKVSASPLYPGEQKTFSGDFSLLKEIRKKVKSVKPLVQSTVVPESALFLVDPMNFEQIAGTEEDVLIKWTIALKNNGVNSPKTLIQAIFLDEDKRNVECTGGSSIVKAVDSGWEGFLSGQLRVERDCWQKVRAMTNTAYTIPLMPPSLSRKESKDGSAVSDISPMP